MHVRACIAFLERQSEDGHAPRYIYATAIKVVHMKVAALFVHK